MDYLYRGRRGKGSCTRIEEKSTGYLINPSVLNKTKLYFMFLIIYALNVVGDTLRDILDPKLLG